MNWFGKSKPEVKFEPQQLHFKQSTTELKKKKLEWQGCLTVPALCCKGAIQTSSALL